ncbi:hypothetical protein KY284_001192 [Solanum tuberosum]|nr:hypothetical protein KY284_001192 [Solanum tuberosum]
MQAHGRDCSGQQGQVNPDPSLGTQRVGDPSLRECRVELANVVTKSFGLPKRGSKPVNAMNKLRCTIKGCTSSS